MSQRELLHTDRVLVIDSLPARSICPPETRSLYVLTKANTAGLEVDSISNSSLVICRSGADDRVPLMRFQKPVAAGSDTGAAGLAGSPVVAGGVAVWASGFLSIRRLAS